MFEGAITALITPFDGDRIDERRLRRNVDHQIEQGISGLAPCGTTGESPTLSHEEQGQVVEVVCEQAGGRVPVIAGAGSNSTAEARSLGVRCKQAGADALLLVNPYYNKPTQEGLYRHFKTLADDVELPQVLYNIPGRTSVALSPRTVARLAEHPNIVAIKEASGSMDVGSEIASLCDPEGLTILSGDDSLTLPLMAIGGRGVISVLGNLLPHRMAEMVRAALMDDFATARRLHLELFPLMRAMFLETNPIPIKTAMKLSTADTGDLRLPLCEMAPDNREALQNVLRQCAPALAAEA